jgi:hypothetical protein
LVIATVIVRGGEIAHHLAGMLQITAWLSVAAAAPHRTR